MGMNPENHANYHISMVALQMEDVEMEVVNCRVLCFQTRQIVYGVPPRSPLPEALDPKVELPTRISRRRASGAFARKDVRLHMELRTFVTEH